MSQKKDLDPKFAMEVALDFESKTKDLFSRIKIAGSLRRKESVVHDVDFAVIPTDPNFESWKENVSKRVIEIGGKVLSFGETISDFMFRGVQVNLFICPGPESWGITFMWATGPKGHTIGMNIKARNKNLLVNSRGIWTRDEPPVLIPTPTEEDVGRVLGWKYKPPEARGKDSKEKGMF